MILDLVDLRDLAQLGDVERAVVERDTVRPVKASQQRPDLPLAVLVDDRIDPVEHAGADKNGPPVADAQ